MSKDEENALVMGLKKGSEIAFEKLVAMFNPKIKGMAYNFTGGAEAVNDIAQNVFFKVFQKIDMFRNESKLSSWVYRITINEIFMYYRKVKKHNHRELNEYIYPDPNNCPKDALLSSELNKLLIKSVQKLDEKEKMVFIFREIEGKSIAEMCQATNASVPAVKSRLLRGRRNLRKSNIGKYLLGEETYRLSLRRAARKTMH